MLLMTYSVIIDEVFFNMRQISNLLLWIVQTSIPGLLQHTNNLSLSKRKGSCVTAMMLLKSVMKI